MLLVSREDIRRVVVILAGSRTGSSFLFSALKSLGAFITPTGEETPFYRRCGLGVFHGSSYSDAIDHIPEDTQLDSVFSALRSDLGVHGLNFNPEDLAEDYFERLNLQWPAVMTQTERQNRIPHLVKKLRERPLNSNWREVYLQWIQELMSQGFSVHTAPFSASERYSGVLPLCEEPPYIHPEPKVKITKQSAAELPLLLKTSTNIYRTEFLRALFPQAEFKWIVLRRNPAATVGALMDGWLSGGFHAHDVSSFTKLAIKGYSDVVPFGDRYWKFDMPPGWQDYVSAPLSEVCAFQWQSAYEAINSLRKSLGNSMIDISYEELISAHGKNKLQQLVRFCETDLRPESAWDAEAPVATVSKPKAGKWRKHSQSILPLLDDSHLRQLAQQFDYDPAHMENWP